MAASVLSETRDSLEGVLSLVSVSQEDFDALTRHDETALALLDIDSEEACEALERWTNCLKSWARSSGSDETAGLWSMVTQRVSALRSPAETSNTPPAAAPILPAHKALAVIVYRAMLLGTEIEDSPHRTPAAAAWAAGRAYLCTLRLPGAGAYGILQPAVLGMLLTNLRSWSRVSAASRPGAGAGLLEAAKNPAKSGTAKRKPPRKRRRETDSSDGSDAEDQGDSIVLQRDAARPAATAVGAGDGDNDVEACLILLKTCLGCVPLGLHQDLVGKLSEVLVGVSVVGAVEGKATITELAPAVLVHLATRSSGHGTAAQGAVLKALMPIILMANGKADVPSRGKDCFKAHDHAINIAKIIANTVATESIEVRPGEASTKAAGDGAVTPAKHETALASSGKSSSSAAPKTPEFAGAQLSPASAIGAGAAGTDEASACPILSMLARLCAWAPERAEARAKLAGGIASLLPEVADRNRKRFVAFLAKFSRNARISHRGFAVELAARLITEAWLWSTGAGGHGSRVEDAGPPFPTVLSSSSHEDRGGSGRLSLESKEEASGGKVLLNMIVARAWDRAPTVRSKAASTLAEILVGIRSSAGAYAAEPMRTAVMEACIRQGGTGSDGASIEGPLLDVLRARVQDEKANVRRNAVPALEALLLLAPAFARETAVEVGDGSGPDGRAEPGIEHAADLLLLEERCNDVSLSTRKAAMTALSSLLMSRPGDYFLQSAWVRALLPLASDPEQTCQNRLVELVQTVILDRVVAWHRSEMTKLDRKPRGGVDAGAVCRDKDGGCSSVWALLAKAAGRDAHRCLKKVISTLLSQRDSSFKPRVVLDALRSAAVMALPSGRDASDPEDGQDDKDGVEEEAEGEWEVRDLRLISLAQTMTPASLSTVRRGTWALLEAFLDRQGQPGTGDDRRIAKELDMDPMFVVRCWDRIRGHIIPRGRGAGRAGGDGTFSPGDQAAALSGADRESTGPEDGEAFESDGRRVLGVLARLASSVPAEVATPLAERLLDMLLDLVALPETSAAIVDALHMLCFAKADSEEAGAAMCNSWANHALSSFEELLDAFIYSGSASLKDHPGAAACGFDMARLVERLLFAVGEVVSVGFSPKEDAAGPSDSQISKAVTVRPKASPRLIALVQVLLPPRLPTSAHGVEDGQAAPATPSAVRALAFVTLGHLCMRDKALAKSSVNILVRELDTADGAAVRSNALIVLGDLCVRYTAMVDRHVGAMAACLQDRHPLVRRHAILLISQLLLQDYVKWRGLLLYRFLATLVDSDISVKDLGTFTLTRPLITKTPGLFAQNFVEALFVLNNYAEHPCYMAAAAGRAEAGSGGVTMEGVDLGGDEPAQVRRRMSVYSTMLQYMSDENKLSVTAKLAQEVLSAAVDGGLPVTKGVTAASPSAVEDGVRNGVSEAGVHVWTKASSVVKDALVVMALPELRVGGKDSAGGEGIEDGSDDLGNQHSTHGGLAAAKSKLLSKVALKHLMETVVPIMTGLKHVLEKAHSPILRELMVYFRELFRTHKEDVKAVLATDPGLVEEIEFDLRRFEKEEQEERMAKKEAAANAKAAQAIHEGAFVDMGPPRTPRAARSGAGGGVASNGRRKSSGTLRAPRTPMAAVMLSARKTPFQNLGDCSTIRLKGSSKKITSPPMAGAVDDTAGAQRHRPKTPMQLRTPREAVAAALGTSPMTLSPLPMRSVLRDEEDAVSKVRSAGDADKEAADVELEGPDSRPPAKKRRWPVTVASPATNEGAEGASRPDEQQPGQVSAEQQQQENELAKANVLEKSGRQATRTSNRRGRSATVASDMGSVTGTSKAATNVGEDVFADALADPRKGYPKKSAGSRSADGETGASTGRSSRRLALARKQGV